MSKKLYDEATTRRLAKKFVAQTIRSLGRIKPDSMCVDSETFGREYGLAGFAPSGTMHEFRVTGVDGRSRFEISVKRTTYDAPKKTKPKRRTTA